MSALARGVWEFIVGDDWTLALGAAVALALTALAVGLDVAAWWVAPVLVPLFLLASLRRALRRDG